METKEKGIKLESKLKPECELGFEREDSICVRLLKKRTLNEISSELERLNVDFDKLRFYVITSYGRKIRYGQSFPELKPDEKLITVCCDHGCCRCEYHFKTSKEVMQHAHQV